MHSTHNESVPEPEVIVQAAVDHLSGEAVHVEGGAIHIDLPKPNNLTPEQLEYIRARRDVKARRMAQLSILRQTSSFPQRFSAYDSEEE